MRWSNKLLIGGLFAGWATFKVVEGIVDHHLLTLHHVKTGDGQLAFDLGFLALGALLLMAGLALARREPRPGPPARRG